MPPAGIFKSQRKGNRLAPFSGFKISSGEFEGADSPLISILEKRLKAGLCATQNQRVHIVSALVGVDRLKVHHVAHHLIFAADTVSAVHVP